MDPLSLPAGTIIKESYWNMGAGITFDGYSFDGGQSWYLLMYGELIEEDLMSMTLFMPLIDESLAESLVVATA